MPLLLSLEQEGMVTPAKGRCQTGAPKVLCHVLAVRGGASITALGHPVIL